VRDWDAERLARAAGAELRRGAADPGGPGRVVVDSREAGPGDLFVGVRGRRADGGRFAAAVLEAGAWGVLVAPEHAEAPAGAGAVLAAGDPVAALGALARSWRRELACPVVGVTGSVGKTSTKDLLAAMLAPSLRVRASRANLNTEIGLPLELTGTPRGTEVLVLEMAMRGFGQIAELAAIAEPDVGVVVNVGPVHLEQVADLDGVARAKGELLQALRPGATAVLPAGEQRLEPYVPAGVRVLRFGPGGDVSWRGRSLADVQGEAVPLELPFAGEHQRGNALAALAAAHALGVRPRGELAAALPALHGERIALPGGVTLVNDCYNASPLSMEAALRELGAEDTDGRRVAVLGDMLELGPDEARYHREAGRSAGEHGVALLVTVGPHAAAMAKAFAGESVVVADAEAAAGELRARLRPGDVVLVKGSRGVGLERVAQALAGQDEQAAALRG